MFFIGFPTPFNHTLPQVLDMYQIIWQAKPIKFIIKLYTDHDTLWVKHATHQKAESLGAASLSKLDNMVKNNSIFNTEHAEFFTKW